MRLLKFILFFCFPFFIESFSSNVSVSDLPSSSYISFSKENDEFVVSDNLSAASIVVSSQDWKGVIRAAQDLALDIEKVSGNKVTFQIDGSLKENFIIAGTIGKSPIIDSLIEQNKIDVSDVKGQWESFIITTVEGNLIIAGSDKRGTIYGIYDLSEQIGVSPWYYWADVPVKTNSEIYVKSGIYIQPSPKVKYRGIFINDEWPSFGGWTHAKFGGFNSKMYTHLFELLLRLKANYLWPAMWSAAFNEDDPMNPFLADEYGIVMGTSHHEPMMRAHNEYTRRRNEVGAWDYKENKEGLDKFFREGMERNKNFENMITIGMRGDGDVALSEEGDEENIRVLKDVVDGQRQIIKEVFAKDPAEIPQVWAIFTEVQRYYDSGFSVPDDVMLMFCDNNWGYIRRTAPEIEKNRSGGLGLYYHIDMNGGPWNDRWINTTTLPKLWEQFNLAYQSGIDRLWVVNVGDLKPKELPIDFIMRYAWDPEAIGKDDLWNYTVQWATSIFGEKNAEQIAELLSKYPKYNLWRKPEVQLPEVMSVVNYNEADRVLELWKDLVKKAEDLENAIPEEARDAFYQLVLYPVKASAGVAEIYIATGKNNVYAKQGRISANDFAERAESLFLLDEELSDKYNFEIANGKWENMMLDKHIGYTKWSMPEENVLPELVYVKPLDYPALGVAVEGDEKAWPLMTNNLALPIFDPLSDPVFHFDLFNRGRGEVEFSAEANEPWIKLTESKGKFDKEIRIFVQVDWNIALKGKTDGIITVTQGENVVKIKVPIYNEEVPLAPYPFFGSLTKAEFSIPAHEYFANKPGKYASWEFIPDLGRGKGNMAASSVTAPYSSVEDAAVLEYKVYLPQDGKVSIALGVLPTQDVNPLRGLRLAAGFNNDKAVIIDARQGFVDTFNEYTEQNIKRSKVLKPLPERSRLALTGFGKSRRNEVFDNIRWLEVELEVKEKGFYVFKVYMIDPEIVLEKIVIYPDNERSSYFGAPPQLYNTNL